ncbi:MAG: hypothetical protein IPF72_19845 [Chitinophagaceae bacterium]|nr:hypothetical protein [Chitinophagaceae bacterium]
MRSKAARRNFKPTQPQLEQQLKFALAVRFIQTITALVEISFGDFAVRKTGFNSAVSYTLKNAVTGTYPVFNLQFADVLVSRGDLPNVLAPTVTVAAGGLVTWAWTDNSGVGIARPTDKALLVVHCPALNQSIGTGSAGRRHFRHPESASFPDRMYIAGSASSAKTGRMYLPACTTGCLRYRKRWRHRVLKAAFGQLFLWGADTGIVLLVWLNFINHQKCNFGLSNPWGKDQNKRGFFPEQDRWDMNLGGGCY